MRLFRVAQIMLAVVILFYPTAIVTAATIIERWNGSSWSAVPMEQYIATGDPPTITFGNNATWGKYRIYTSPLSDLPRLDVSQISTAGTNQYVWVFIGKPNQPVSTSEPLLDPANAITAGAVNWRGVIDHHGQVSRQTGCPNERPADGRA